MQMFKPLSQAIDAALRASIQRFGVIVPIVVDQDGQVIDGHHRRHIALELDAECPQITRQVASADEAREIAVTLNADRRQLTLEQRREVVAALRIEGHSSRAIAGALGVSHTTVLDDAKVETSLTPDEKPIDLKEKKSRLITGRDGKRYQRRETMAAAMPNPRNQPQAKRYADIARLAAGGHRAEQIADEIGMLPKTIREFAKKHGIKLADAQIGKVARINVHRVIEETVIGLSGYASGLQLIEGRVPDLSREQAAEWAASLTESLKPLVSLRKLLREVANGKE